MENKNYVWIVVVIAIVAGVIFLNKGSDEPLQIDGDINAFGIGVNPVENYIPVIKFNEGYYSNFPIQTTSTLTVTATSTQGSAGTPSYTVRGGADSAWVQQSWTATSSSVCAIKNPYGATTTLRSFTAVSTSGSFDGAGTWTLSTSTTVVGSSTPAFVHEYPVAAGDFQFMAWRADRATSTKNSGLAFTFEGESQPDGSSPFFVAPIEYVTWEQATSTAGSETVTGTCTAIFDKP